jgi:hypothetical protein
MPAPGTQRRGASAFSVTRVSGTGSGSSQGGLADLQGDHSDIGAARKQRAVVGSVAWWSM